jgi:thiol-disulfide isomerase/thioredoxin
VTSLTKKLLVLLAVLVVALIGSEQYRKATAPVVKDFEGKTLKGEHFDLRDHRGKRPVLISFYATWCGPCQMEVDHLMKLSREYKKRGLQVVVITAEPPEAIKAHPIMAYAPLTIIPNAEKIFERFEIGPIPHSYFLKPNGQVLEMDGYSDEMMMSMEKAVEETMAGISAKS